MKKHIKVILIILLVLAVCGVGLWFVLSRTKTETLPKTVSSFINSDSTTQLHSRLQTSQSLYSRHYSDTRLMTLKDVLTKLDEFEKDLESYLIMSNASARSTKDLTKSYSKLSESRASLIKDCDEFIIRLNGNTLAQGQTVKALYDSLFNKTVNHLSQYNTCFANTSNYVFTNVTSSNNIKFQLYNLYSYGVMNTFSNIANNQFKSLETIKILNRTIKLDSHGNILIKSSLDGGEFNTAALDFRKYYNLSNKETLISNFSEYYSLNINSSTETSKEKLTVYYFKQIVEA